MNRPKIENSLTRRMYTDQLERYCDELEQREKPMTVHKKSPMEEARLGNAWFCPNCDNWLIRVNNVNYCPNCGQRLGYEDE